MEDPNIKHSLQKLQQNYFNAAIANVNIANDVSRDLKSQVFGQTGTYLLFTATLFFFLSSKLDVSFLRISVRVLLSIGIISASLSIVIGLITLIIEQKFVLTSARKSEEMSQKVLNYIQEHDVVVVKEIPDELMDKSGNMKINISKWGSKLGIIQISLFTLSVGVNILGIVIAIK